MYGGPMSQLMPACVHMLAGDHCAMAGEMAAPRHLQSDPGMLVSSVKERELTVGGSRLQASRGSLVMPTDCFVAGNLYLNETCRPTRLEVAEPGDLFVASCS